MPIDMSERPPVTDWATDFDHLSEEWAADGPEILADLRERCPVAQTERFYGAYLVTRHDDIVETARATDTFSNCITAVNHQPSRQDQARPVADHVGPARARPRAAAAAAVVQPEGHR